MRPAIASSLLATEWLKGKTLDEGQAICNTDIVHFAPAGEDPLFVLAEDANKAAIADYKTKNRSRSKTTTTPKPTDSQLAAACFRSFPCPNRRGAAIVQSLNNHPRR